MGREVCDRCECESLFQSETPQISHKPILWPTLLSRFARNAALLFLTLVMHMPLISKQLYWFSAVEQLQVHMKMNLLKLVCPAEGSYSASPGGVVKSCFMLSKACICCGPQFHTFVFLKSSRRGRVISAKCGRKVPRWFVIPRNRLTSEMLRSFMALYGGDFLWVWTNPSCLDNLTQELEFRL